mmetsp:Transcript_89925/g.178711  ORF Transcript_89925/g.178711 Transcript_89925/m.178711 type:complete len:257 (-) Transcript_89925:133-903(-)|eukprot:CAMPEP_0172718018 /NCGR_PEP_ID=MMETSP1074-20121228/73197_1 /TAXON_ID=2916 /ORGANISM="Ceratium fusus, Strain PA161109" /LENGTH=256 /DNA_ID=CAMNT_0013543099 /DNA_START=29 /DNA_END=796 /DNA_ORIENTATION=-
MSMLLPRRGGRRFEVEKELTDVQKAEIKEAFDLFDMDGSGEIDLQEMHVAMRALGLEPSKEETEKFLLSADSDDSGHIGYREFEQLMSKKLLKVDPLDEVVRVFRLLDSDQTGKISFDNLNMVAKEIGVGFTDDKVQDMIDNADKDGDGEINLDEFMDVMKRRMGGDYGNSAPRFEAKNNSTTTASRPKPDRGGRKRQDADKAEKQEQAVEPQPKKEGGGKLPPAELKKKIRHTMLQGIRNMVNTKGHFANAHKEW